MGILYKATKYVKNPRWQGLSPTSLEELEDKISRMGMLGVGLSSFDVRPTVTESEDCYGDPNPFGYFDGSYDYDILYVARFGNDRVANVKEGRLFG